MNHCYILYSRKLNKYYTGISSESVESRLKKHNKSSYGNHFTSQTSDWEIFFVIECECNTQAINIERHIKKMKSVTYIQNLRKYPEMVIKLKLKYLCN